MRVFFSIPSRPFLASFALVVVLATTTATHAASIECLKTWPGSSIGDAKRAERVQALIREMFPSGFSPLGRCKAAGIIGRIEKGDHAAFRKLYRANHPALESVYLISPGGDADEAISIGLMLRKYLLEAYAPAGSSDGTGFLTLPKHGDCAGRECVCASACALIWFGAVSRSGEVGLHRPIITDPTFRTMAPSKASRMYKRVLGRVKSYLADVETSPALINAMVATDSSEIKWVNEWDHLLKEPPSIAEWINSSCGAFTENQIRKYIELITRRGRGGSLTADEEDLSHKLGMQYSKRLNCMWRLKRVHRDALSPP